jgi:hypothetical protein
MDPTVTFSDAEHSFLHLAGQKVLILQEGDSRLEEIPLPPDQIRRIETRSEIRGPGPDGGWEMHGDAVLRGPLAQEWALQTRYASPEDARNWLRREISNALGIEAASFGLDSVSTSRVKVSYVCKLVGKRIDLRKGGFLLDTPIPGIARLNLDQKEGPMDVPALEQEDTWVLPAGYTRLQFQRPGSDSVDYEWSQEGNLVRRRFRTPVRNFPPDNAEAVRRYRSGWNSSVDAIVWVP